jgi:transposase
MAQVQKREIPQRTEKWEILPDLRRKPSAKLEGRIKRQREQERVLLRVSEGNREYEEWALKIEDANYRKHQEVLWALAHGVHSVCFINAENRPKCTMFTSKPEADLLRQEILAEMKEKRTRKDQPKRVLVGSFLNDQNLYRLYTPIRARDKDAQLQRASNPANWVLESCFSRVAAAYQSFFALLKRGDRDAHTMKPTEVYDFVAIQGALSPSSLKSNGTKLVLAPDIFPGQLEFDIPPHQARLLAERSKRLAKFVISRTPSDLREPGRYWISVSYQIEDAEPVPFVPEQAVYLSLGTSHVGIVSPKGEQVLALQRSDKRWKPLVDAVQASLKREPDAAHPRPLQKGSRMWKKLEAKRRRMFRFQSEQQKKDRREGVASLAEREVDETSLSKAERRFDARHGGSGTKYVDRIFGHGVHFVVADIAVRSKPGKLADKEKPERSGPHGINYGAQNTGTLGYFVQWLEIQAKERGGSVRKHRPSYPISPESLLDERREPKIPQAYMLRDDFLRSLQKAA